MGSSFMNSRYFPNCKQLLLIVILVALKAKFWYSEDVTKNPI